MPLCCSPMISEFLLLLILLYFFSPPQRYNSRHLWSTCLDLVFIYRGLPYLPAKCEPLIACSCQRILTSWTLPSKDLRDPQSWEWRVNSEQYNSRKCLWTPAVKNPRLLCFPLFGLLVLIMSLDFVWHLRIIPINFLYDEASLRWWLVRKGLH